MIIPVRCISCGRILADKWDEYKAKIEEGKTPKKVLDELGVKSYCCRGQFLTHVELIDLIARYKQKAVPVE